MSFQTALSPARAPFVRASGISRSFGDLRVLTDVTVTVHAGARAGLIGANGSGKTTLLRILAGLEEPDAGTVEVPDGARVGLLTQEFPLPATTTVGGAAHLATRELRAVAAEVERAGAALADDPGDPGLGEALERALARADALDVWSLDAARDRMLAGLGLGTLDPAREVGSLSGGQRARLSLACLLLSRPDVLLLDEPTNHLDDDAAAFLARVLSTWRGPVVAASHDRAFLDDIATEILDLDPVESPHHAQGPRPSPRPRHAVAGASGGEDTVRGLTRTRGRYSDHVLERLAGRDAWEERFAREQDELRRLKARTHEDRTVGHPGRGPRTEARASVKFYSDRNARVVKRRVDDTRRRLEVLKRAQVRRPPRDLTFAGLDVGGVPDVAGAALRVRSVAVTGRLRPLTLDLGPGEHLLVTGPNGSGKSTLAEVLTGGLAPDSGTVDVVGSVALLGQDPAPREGSATVAEAYRTAVGEERAAAVSLSAFGLVEPRDLARPVALLSTGQRRRLDLACVLADPPAVLVLDEPTNHLSLDLVTALESLLPDYPGILVVTSHDRWLRRMWTGRTLELRGWGRD